MRTCDLISLDAETPSELGFTMAMTEDLTAVPETVHRAADAAPAAAAPGPLPGFGANQGRQARRQARRRVGAKLLPSTDSQPLEPSFEPSKVCLRHQTAKQLGATPKNATSREVKVIVEAPGLSASQDIGLTSFLLCKRCINFP
ncbi:unnamed protein product [Durusdinium trenchii]|uniref:Uncharacterized protein n=2 Tax=Durusdinium trenchii TaxID=1381693 RepID=A0ABP0JYY5_9DINO